MMSVGETFWQLPIGINASNARSKNKLLKNCVSYMALGAALCIGAKIFEFVHIHGIDGFKEAAHQRVCDSLQDLTRGDYALSWSRMIPARMNYAGDMVLQAARLPFSFLLALYRTGEVFVSWGHTATAFSQSYTELLENINRIVRGLMGTAISPTFAFKCKNSNVVGAILTGILAAMPTSHYYTVGHGWSYGWHQGRF